MSNFSNKDQKQGKQRVPFFTEATVNAFKQKEEVTFAYNSVDYMTVWRTRCLPNCATCGPWTVSESPADLSSFSSTSPFTLGADTDAQTQGIGGAGWSCGGCSWRGKASSELGDEPIIPRMPRRQTGGFRARTARTCWRGE
jgi:hypothetical protein